MNDQELLARFRDCLARAEQRERGCVERIESWRLAKRASTPPESMLGSIDNEAWPDLLRERNLVAEEVRLYRDAVAKLEARLPKVEPYRPWVVNLNPAPREQGGGRYGRLGVVTNAANGRADVSYDDGVGMQVDIKKHLVLVADLGFVDKERLRCGCGSGFPSLWCCWNREPVKRETGYKPRVTYHERSEERVVKVDENSFDAGGFRCLILERADGTTYSAPASGLSLAPKALLLEPECACGSGKDSLRCHPMSKPRPRMAELATEPPEPKHVGACPCDVCREYDALLARREREA